jgi:hypothetical protein
MNKLIETMPKDVIDYIENRIHAHEETSLKYVNTFSTQLQALTDIIHSHDEILSSDNVKIILELIEESKRLKTIHESDVRRAQDIAKTGGFILGLAGVISSLVYIYQWGSSHIK